MPHYVASTNQIYSHAVCREGVGGRRELQQQQKTGIFIQLAACQRNYCTVHRKRVERIIVVGYSTLHLVITFTPFYFHDLEYACFYAM